MNFTQNVQTIITVVNENSLDVTYSTADFGSINACYVRIITTNNEYVRLLEFTITY